MCRTALGRLPLRLARIIRLMRLFTVGLRVLEGCRMVLFAYYPLLARHPLLVRVVWRSAGWGNGLQSAGVASHLEVPLWLVSIWGSLVLWLPSLCLAAAICMDGSFAAIRHLMSASLRALVSRRMLLSALSEKAMTCSVRQKRASL